MVRRREWSHSLFTGYECGPGIAPGLRTRMRTTHGGSGGYDGGLELIERVAGWGWIHGEDHTLLAVTGLLAVDPDGVGVQDREGHRGEVVSYISADGVESRGKANMSDAVWSKEGRAGFGEGRLRHSVVLLTERKRDFVSDISVNVRGVVYELGVWTNNDVVVLPGEGKGQGEKKSEDSVEHHYVVVAGIVRIRGLEK